MPQYDVRLADFGDVEIVLDLLKKAVIDVEYLGVSDVDREPIEEFLVGDITECAAFLLFCGDALVGILAGVVNSHPVFYQSKAASEWFWYVLPEHRKHMGGIKLINAYENWARRIGADFASMSHFHDETGDRLSKIYTRMGYKPIEHSYYKELN